MNIVIWLFGLGSLLAPAGPLFGVNTTLLGMYFELYICTLKGYVICYNISDLLALQYGDVANIKKNN